MKQGLATDVSCNGMIEQRSITASKDVLRYMNASQSKAVKSQNTVRKFFFGSFAVLFQWLQALFTQEVAAVFKSIDDSWREAWIELWGSIFECEATAKGLADR